MAAKPLPPQGVLRQLMTYEPETGKLFWKERGPEWFRTSGHTAEHTCNRWNSKFAGREAFTATKGDGYKHGSIGGQNYAAHRLIWVLMTGDEPDQVDHIDGNRANNRWSNLRNVSASINRRNASRHRDNRSGVTGVRRVSRGGWSKWQAFIQTKDGFIHLGVFELIEEATAARKAAEVAYGFHPNHGREAKT